MKTVDFLIIGSGLGGLVSALILAKEGYKVAIVEKNQQLGGNLQTFSRNKCIFDTGVHYLGGLSKGQNLYQYFDFLGIAENLKLQKMDENGFDRITFEGDSAEYPHAQGYENFVENLAEIFPDERENLENYIKKIREVCDAFPGYNLDLNGRYQEELMYENAKKYIDSVTENQTLRNILAGSNFLYASGEETPLPVHALTVNSYIQSAFRCINGGSQITKLLVKELRKLDVKIFKRTKISKFELNEKGDLSCAVIDDETQFFAKNFISNIDIQQTLKLCGENNFQKSFRERVKSLKPGPACFSVYVVLKPKSVPYFNHNIYHFKNPENIWKNFDFNPENWPESYMLSCTESQQNQGFAESLIVLSYMDFADVEAWQNSENSVVNPHERNQDYENFKQEKAIILIQELEKKFPNLSENIQSVHTSSPLSYRDYIGTSNGSMYGYEKSSENPMKTMFSPRTKIKNLYQTGQSVNMHGILGVTIGAFNTCAEILGREYLNEKLKPFRPQK